MLRHVEFIGCHAEAFAIVGVECLVTDDTHPCRVLVGLQIERVLAEGLLRSLATDVAAANVALQLLARRASPRH